MLHNLEKELTRWRNGESVPVHERSTSVKEQKAILPAEVVATTPVSQSPQATVTVVNHELSEEERRQFDEERSKLYKQLDERVCLLAVFLWSIIAKSVRMNLQCLKPIPFLPLFSSQLFLPILPFSFLQLFSSHLRRLSLLCYMTFLSTQLLCNGMGV